MKQSQLQAPLLVLLALTASLGRAENWPQWRGPFFDGSTTEANLPTTFSKTENVAWVVPMPGQSGATPIVWGDRVFISSVDEGARRLLAICIDAKTGKTLWQKETGRDRRVARNNMASPSPIADGKTVYFFYGTAELFAFAFDGKLLWQRDLEKDHGHNALMFGYSSSPLLYKGKLYVVAIRNKRQDRYRQAPAARSESRSPTRRFKPATTRRRAKTSGRCPAPPTPATKPRRPTAPPCPTRQADAPRCSSTAPTT